MKKMQSVWPLRASRIALSSIVGLSFYQLSATASAQFSGAPANSSGSLLQQNQPLLSPDRQRRPDAGDSDDKTAPVLQNKPAQNAGPSILVSRFELSEALPEPAASDVRQLFAQVEGQRLNLAQINRVRALLNGILQQKVDLLTYATLPPQQVTDGRVHFTIGHGHVGQVSLENNKSLVSNATLAHYFPDAEEGQAPRGIADIERAVHLIQNLSGVGNVKPVLSPGAAVGTTQVDLQVEPAPRVSGAVLLDNSGSSSGKYRAGGQLVVNSPFGIGDKLQALLLAAPSHGQDAASEGGHTAIGQLSYDLPLGYSGMRGGVQYARVQYKSGGPDHDILDGNGYADVVTLNLSKPLIDRNDANLTLGTTLSYKNLSDSLFELSSKRQSVVAGVKLSGFRYGTLADRVNVVQFDAALESGHLTQNEYGVFDDPDGLQLGGQFSKLSGNLEYTQKIREGLAASLKSSVQLASRHLDSSEQMTLGGSQGVRGYGLGLASVDQGALASLALTQDISALRGLSVAALYDIARGQISKQPVIGDNTFTVQSAGLGLNYQYNKKFLASVSYSRRLGDTPEGQAVARQGQTWFNAVLTF